MMSFIREKLKGFSLLRNLLLQNLKNLLAEPMKNKEFWTKLKQNLTKTKQGCPHQVKSIKQVHKTLTILKLKVNFQSHLMKQRWIQMRTYLISKWKRLSTITKTSRRSLLLATWREPTGASLFLCWQLISLTVLPRPLVWLKGTLQIITHRSVSKTKLTSFTLVTLREVI